MGKRLTVGSAVRGPAKQRIAPLILCYHAVSASWDHELAVPVDAMRTQLERMLKGGFSPVTAGEALQRSGNLLHVTFDDAFKSVEHALPILEKLGVPATVFACASHAETGAPLDVPELHEEVERHPEELATLDWNELRSLADRGVEIGSHTVTHPRLPLTSDEVLQHELVESKRRIEQEIGRPCRFLAYPYGDHDSRVRRAAAAAGYEAAFALPVGTRWADPYQVNRVGVWRSEGDIRVGIKTSRFFRTALGASVMRARDRRRRLARGMPVDQAA